ncbi:MAG: type II secretion system protein F [Actinophytocola sp.]|nr:type II secretion system protein F [Actinophytocola sp.]
MTGTDMPCPSRSRTCRSRRLSSSAAVVQDGLVADFVAYRYGEADTSAITHLAEASGGRVLKAENAAQLASAFAEIAREPSTVPEKASAEPVWLAWLPDWSWQVLVVAALSFLGLLALILGVVFALRPREDTGKRLLDELSRYGPRREPSSQRPEQQMGSFARAVGVTEDILRSRGWEEKLAEQLDLADVTMKPAEWTVLRVCLGIAASAVLIVFGTAFFIAIPLGGALVWAGAYLGVRIRISRRRSAFADQLPDVLQLIAGSLRSGFSLSQALDAVVRDDTQPSAGEFARALAETRIGVELEDGLDRVAVRMASDDLKWVVMAIRIQREVGGNLAEVLLTTVTTMRERAQVRRQVRALSAEGRLSAYILLGLPFIVGGLLAWMNPGYMEPLYTTGIGIVMLVGAGVLMSFGTFWMTRLVKVEV